MAERRMFSKSIIDSDAFLDMPATTQLLYFHMAMRADDDGFVNQPRSIMRICGSKDDDAKMLIAKKFILPFDSGVIVIKHWRIHNYIRKDTYVETKYKDEKRTLELDENGSYRHRDEPVTIPSRNCNESLTQVSREQISKEKNKSVASEDAPPARIVHPTLDMVTTYFKEAGGTMEQAEQFCDYYNSNGWKVGNRAPMKDWRAAARRWIRNEKVPAATNKAKESGRIVDRPEPSGTDILHRAGKIKLKRSD